MSERICPEMSRPMSRTDPYGNLTSEMFWVPCDPNCGKRIGNECALVVAAKALHYLAEAECAAPALRNGGIVVRGWAK